MRAFSKIVLITVFITITSGFTNWANAADFRTVGDKPAVWFDGPSAKATKLFVLPKFSPVEIVVALDQWSKVRDETGDLGWVENKSFGTKRHVKTIVDADIKASASDGAGTVFTASRGLGLELADTTNPANTSSGWVKVTHRDGQSGWIQAIKLWGL